MNRVNKGKGRCYWIYGRHAVGAVLRNRERVVHQLLATQNVADELGCNKTIIVNSKEIDKKVGEDAVHQGVAAEVDLLPEKGLDDIVDKNRVVILDQVTDPHNIGAILRSCGAFAVDGLIMQDKNAPGEGGVMAKSASGALETIPLIVVTNLSSAMEELKENDFWCIGMDGSANETISKINDYEKIALVLGAEGKGLRRLVKENCDLLVKVPINDAVESLNVSNAAAVAMYELSRES